MQKRTDDTNSTPASTAAAPQRRSTLVGRAIHASSGDTQMSTAPVREDLGPLVGRTFGGYEIVSYIGEGPSGAVYRGEDLLGNAMAVKVLHPGLANKTRTDQLKREIERLSALDHPLLQRIYDSGYGEEGQFYYVTDELIGCDLETGLEDSGGLAPRKSYEIIRAVCQALETAHAAGVVHGGLRPRNVFLLPQDHGTAVKVLDFGAARLGAGSDRGMVAGLPAYLAPEQLTGPSEHVATVRSDLYALGVLMYELFSGTAPGFRGGQAGALAGRRGPVVPPTGVDAQLSRLIVSLLDAEPARRLPSAAAVLSELGRWAGSPAGTALLDPHHPAVVRRRGPASASGSIGPNSTHRMSKFDAMALAQETLPAAPTHDARPDQDADVLTGRNLLEDASDSVPRFADEEVIEPADASPTRGRKTMTQNPDHNNTAKEEREPNASESVEASLEDFISQANASFPAADGWDLHTGDVELVEDETGTARLEARAPQSQPALSRPGTERTEIVSQPLPVATGSLPALSTAPAATSNPLFLVGGTLVCVFAGAIIAFALMKTGAPAQPAPQVIVQPAAAPVAAAPVAAAPAPVPAPTAAAPVVTPIAASPTAAVVTPAPAPEPPPLLAPPVVRHHATAAPKAPRTHAEPKSTAPAKEPAAKKEAAPAKKDAAPAKKGDWVDPFAN